jgi:hypothetical protein
MTSLTQTQKTFRCAVAGGLAGAANGFFGAGGGMVLVPLLLRWVKLEEKRAFATSVAIILPMCLVSAVIYWFRTGLDFGTALPYLLGGLIGGYVGGKLFSKVPSGWLRRALALFLVYGGVRNLLW